MLFWGSVIIRVVVFASGLCFGDSRFISLFLVNLSRFLYVKTYSYVIILPAYNSVDIYMNLSFAGLLNQEI